MAGDSAAPRGGAFTRGRAAFRRWRKTRPFWGGLLLVLSGLWILYSANESLGALQVHLGMSGFQSYVIPAVLILCGALSLGTPDQRMFYGIIGVLVAIYSIVGVNLGGFLVGFLLGVFGGALAVAWVPEKHKSVVADETTADLPTSEADATSVDETDEDVQESQGLDVIGHDDEDVTTGPLHDTLPTSTRSPLVPTQASGDGDEDQEDEQGGSFPRPRHAADESEVAGSDLQTDPDETPGLASRLRKPPNTAIALLAVLSLGAVALVTFQSPSSAAAESCATPAYQRALESLGAAPSASPKSTSKRTASDSAARTSKDSKNSTGTAGKSTTVSGGASPKSVAKPASTPQASASPSTTAGPLTSLLNVVGSLLPGAEPADGSSDSPSPSASPTGTTDPSPSTSPTQSPKPSAAPTGTPTGHPTATPTKTIKPSSPSPSPSDSPICSVSKVFSAAGVGLVNKNPSKMTTADLTMHKLAYKGIADLPTEGGGTLQALWFTMDSSTSTPFELQPMVGADHSIDIKSSELTVSGNVQFYCTSISGKLVVAGVGLVPLTFTVASPPPLVLSEMEFTDVTIQLAYVQSDVLTAKSLDISTT